MDSKVCTKCGTEKPLTEFNRSGRGDRRRTHCRACQAEYRRGYYADADERAANLDREQDRRRAWYAANREREAVTRRSWHEANIDVVRARRIRRRRLKAGAVSEPYTRVEICQRDGWVCQICATPVDPVLQGTSDPSAPSIDHIVPLSLGGDDTPANVQLAHFGCNSGKCNRRVEAVS